MILSAQSIRVRRVFSPQHERTLHVETGMTYGLGPSSYDVRVAEEVILRPRGFGLFSTLEHWTMPRDLCAGVRDKSSLARRGLAVQNTHVDPGWRGHLTLEVTNHGQELIYLPAGSPIAQVVLEMLDEPTEIPYNGKYQDQSIGPQKAK